jgi:hypothetical protein
MRRATLALLLTATMLLAAGCTHKEQTTTNSSESAGAAESSASSEQQTTAPAPSVKQYVTFQFSDIAVTTSAAPVLRLGFTVKNGGSDPLLCTESAFSLQLSDGTTLAPDAGAENRCDPDTIDPGSSGKVTMFFDLKNSYSGPATVIMRDNTNAIIGQGTAQVH